MSINVSAIAKVLKAKSSRPATANPAIVNRMTGNSMMSHCNHDGCNIIVLY